MGRWTFEYIHVPATVQNVQNVQNATSGTKGIPFERSEHFERSPGDIETDAGVSAATPFADALTELENHRPEGVGEARWHEALKEGRRFVETWGSQAAIFGWTASDLFGLHPIAPLARYDAMGLIWLLRGRTVVALTETRATIRSSSSATLSFQRDVS
jgi:hypothetical protein